MGELNKGGATLVQERLDQRIVKELENSHKRKLESVSFIKYKMEFLSWNIKGLNGPHK